MFGSSTYSLFGDLDVEITPDAPIGAMTWYGVGGRADLLVRPADVDSLALLVKRCHRSGTPLRIFGSGANLLVADEGVDGIVLRLDGPAFQETKFKQAADFQRLRAMAGADMAKTLMDAARRGLEGLSQMTGIPASIGGAVRMNAGGSHGCIGDTVHSVTCITRSGEKVTYPAQELRFTYRATNIPDPVIIAASFNLTPTDPIALRQKVKEIFAEKKAAQPLGDHSAGCAFKNPIDPAKEKRVSAGKLIDRAGLKDETIGGATVSRRHANFIVTQPGATASDVISLMKLVKQRVFSHAGIELKEEIVIWRRGEEP